MRKFMSILVAAAFVVLSACSGAEGEGEIDTIVFADAGWDSIRVHNNIAQRIIEEGYGYNTDVKTGSTATTFEGFRKGDINVYMEVWSDNIKEVYGAALDAGDIEEVSVNFDDNDQGLYVPTYVIEGDEERDIKPAAPDLKTVEDLKKYPEVFEDPEDPGRGRLINAPSGWELSSSIDKKFEVYGLDETINNFMPGSDSAIVASLVDAYKNGEPWVGYYWAPTAVTAKYDLTLLEEAPYDEEEWEETKATAFPPNDVTIAVHKDLPEQAPDVVDFLSNYETSSELTEEALKYMDENGATPEEAAAWWMKEHEDLWTGWLDEETAEKVKDTLD